MHFGHLAARATGVAGVTTVAIPASPPSNAVTMNPSFPGVSFELSTFSLYAQSKETPRVLLFSIPKFTVPSTDILPSESHGFVCQPVLDQLDQGGV